MASTTNAPQVYVLKTPRQGAYDNFHVNAAMCPDSQGRPTVAAPFCADKCIHLHVRWGTIAAGNKYAFLGWGNGRLDQGAHSFRGAPLVPPNQHVDFVCNVPDNKETADLEYAVTAWEPRERELQVILEQGIGVGFSYSGMPAPWGALPFLAGLLNIAPPLIADQDDVRAFFPKIYEALRWYSQDPDGTTEQQVPGDPSISNPDIQSQLSGLEDL